LVDLLNLLSPFLPCDSQSFCCITFRDFTCVRITDVDAMVCKEGLHILELLLISGRSMSLSSVLLLHQQGPNGLLGPWIKSFVRWEA
jgi:hypothetical protein